ncbi:MAG: bifunctional NADH dehydrogenase FAD-containing subunit/selenide, water dikinase SelD, partial [Betaproteobacteria bacterium]
AARAGCRFIEDSAAGVDLAQREVITAGGGRLVYDLLSLDIGSTSGDPARVSRHALRLRPVEGFLAGWERLREAARRSEVRRIAVVGGGAAGIEVLLAMQHGLAGVAAEFALFSELPILAGHGARRRIARILLVVAVREGGLELEGGEGFDAQATVWATGAGAPSWIAQSGLATDPRGFVAVSGTLRSPSHPEVFAAGDCATIIGDSRPKSGVIAVRQGPILAGNLRLALAGAPPEPFRAPARALALISCGDRYAVASWASFALEGSWVWRCKDRIDRRFVQRYRLGGAGD